MKLELRALVQAVIVGVVVLAAGAVFIAHRARLGRVEQRQRATELARGSAFALEQELARSLDSVLVLAAMVREGASDQQLEAVAGKLLEMHGGRVNLQLAQDGVINRLWPLAGNEAARGLDLTHHPIQGPYVARLRATRRPLLYGPFELAQGGQGLAVRTPVFVREGQTERFWGLSSAIIRLPVLLEASRISRLGAAGYDYQLFHPGHGAERDALLATSLPDRQLLAEPVEVDVVLLDQTWRLGVAPTSGWSTSGSWVLQLTFCALALLAGLLAYRTLSIPALLRREVAARTAELAVAHREQQAALEARRQAEKLETVGLLAGGVAHDFNNLLTAILGHAELLASDGAPAGEARDAAQTITQAAQRAADLTRQLLAFARLGQHRQEPVDLHALIAEATRLLSRTLDKSIRIETRLLAPHHHVLGDAGQLQQLIINLAVNARDAMPGGGTLTLETSGRPAEAVGPVSATAAPEAWLLLTVSDTGSGIPRHLLERIFEPFFTTKAEGRGTGLGLSTVYGIAKAHGGDVRVESEEHVGTRFTVYLAALAAPAVSPVPAEAPPHHGSGVVLVVDDEEAVRRTATRMLRTLGYQPEAVAGGQEALDWLATHATPPAAVLLDLAMPGMDGATCFRAMRQQRADLRVVLSSGFAPNAGVQRLIEAGAQGFVQKPYRLAELAKGLAAALEGGR